MHFFRVFALVLPIATAAGLFAAAASAPDYGVCGDEDAEVDDRILACTQIVGNSNIPAEVRAQAYNNRGQAYSGDDDHNAAIADYARAIELAPNNSDSFNLLAWSYLKAGQAEKGLPSADRAVRLNPKSANAYDTRAHIYEALGKRREAAFDFRRALLLDPELQESMIGLKRLGIVH